MDYRHMLVWTEGTLLGQQHFQYWDNFLAHKTQQLSLHALPWHWGITQLLMSDDHLLQHIVSVDQIQVLLPDRRWVHFHSQRDGALSLALPENSTDSLPLYLLIPRSEAIADIPGYDAPNHGVFGYHSHHEMISDRYDSNREQELLLAKSNLSLSYTAGEAEQFISIQIANLSFEPQRMVYQFDKQYIPPVMQVGHASALVSWLVGMIGRIEQHLGRLHTLRGKYLHAHNQLAYADFVYFNLGKTLSSYLPRLKQVQIQPNCHPFYVFDLMQGLLGELGCYSDQPIKMDSVIGYDPEDLSVCFTALRQKFSQLIEAAMPADRQDIPLTMVKECLYESDHLSEDALIHQAFCLAVMDDDIDSETIEQISNQLKVASPTSMDAIAQRYVTGVPLSYAKSPGKDLMAQRHYHYFLLDKSSTYWGKIVEEKQLSIFIPQSLNHLNFELLCY